MASESDLLARANLVLNVAGLEMEASDNGEGKGFKNIIDIETKVKVGQQSIHESYELIEFEKGMIGWLCNYKFNEGFKFCRSTH